MIDYDIYFYDGELVPCEQQIVKEDVLKVIFDDMEIRLGKKDPDCLYMYVVYENDWDIVDEYGLPDSQIIEIDI